MFDRKELKRRAKTVLLRSYTKVFLACLAVYLVSGGTLNFATKKINVEELAQIPPQRLLMIFAVIGAIAVIGLLLQIFVFLPLNVGLKRFMLDNAKSNAKLDLLLTPFDDGYWNIVKAQFMKEFIISLWAIPAVIPTVLLAVFYKDIEAMVMGIYDGSTIAAAAFLGTVALWTLSTLLFAVPSIIKSLQYTLVPYLLADNPHTEWRTAMSKSKEMMVGNKWQLVKLVFSFTLWYLLAGLVGIVGSFLLLPYIEATMCEFYMALSGNTPLDVQYE